MDALTMNRLRASTAYAAVGFFARTTDNITLSELSPEDLENYFSDLLCNMMHLAGDRDWDFEALLERATSHYHEESKEAE